MSIKDEIEEILGIEIADRGTQVLKLVDVNQATDRLLALMDKVVLDARINELAHMVCCDHSVNDIKDFTPLKNVDKSWKTNVCHGEHYKRINTLHEQRQTYNKLKGE